LFTIAIPTFNRSTLLTSCLESALGQTDDSFEVVVSDNASEDDTARMLAACSDPRLRVLKQSKNIGPIPNWNACVAATKGAYVAVVSDDDAVRPHFLQRCRQVLDVNDEVPVIVALGDVLEDKSGITRQAALSRRLTSGVCHGTDVLLEFLRGRISPQMCTVVMRTALLRARGGFPDGWPHTGDLATWVPMLLDGDVGFVNESCGTYRNHAGTQTSKFSVDVRLKDIHRLAQVIVATAETAVDDPQLRREIRDEANRYVARNCVGHITIERRKGLSRTDSLRAAWRWRRQLSWQGLESLGDAARALVWLVLPISVIRFVGSLKRRLRPARAS
jgi:glycosyltransferase involved in cell wall biosynthesis